MSPFGPNGPPFSRLILLGALALAGCSTGRSSNLLAEMRSAQAEEASVPAPPRNLMRTQTPAPKTGGPLVILGPDPAATPVAVTVPEAPVASAPAPAAPTADPYAVKRVALAPG